MQAIKAPVHYADHSSLEELAVHRLQSLPHGAGFWAYSEIVQKVRNVCAAEDKAARMRAKAIQDLTPGEID